MAHDKNSQDFNAMSREELMEYIGGNVSDFTSREELIAMARDKAMIEGQS